MDLSESEWKKKLTPDQYRIIREKATETPFSGELLDEKRKGVFNCAACGAELFKSDHKFDSGTGWPSFFDIASTGTVELYEDNSLGMQRVEVVCSNCGGHLGHLFDDGPSDKTGKRYCINSTCLAFNPSESQK